MHYFTLLSIEDKTIHFRDQSGTGVALHAQADQLIRSGLIEFFDFKDAKQIVTVSGIPGSLLTRLVGTSLHIPTSRLYFLPFFVALFVAALAFSVPMSIRSVDLGLFTVPVGVFIFPLAFVSTDIINELFGYQMAKQVIRYVAAILLILALPMYVCIHLPDGVSHHPSTSSSDVINSSFHVMYADMPKIMIIMSVSLLIADTCNAFLFARIRSWLQGKGLWLRSLISSTFSMTAYSLAVLIIFSYHQLLDVNIYLRLLTRIGFMATYFIAALPLLYGVRRYIFYQEKKMLEAQMKALNAH